MYSKYFAIDNIIVETSISKNYYQFITQKIILFLNHQPLPDFFSKYLINYL